jgi:hypothetical protein
LSEPVGPKKSTIKSTVAKKQQIESEILTETELKCKEVELILEFYDDDIIAIDTFLNSYLTQKLEILQESTANAEAI